MITHVEAQNQYASFMRLFDIIITHTGYYLSRSMTKSTPSKNSDQPGHPPSLISPHCLTENALDPWLLTERQAKNPIRLGTCPG